MGPTTLHENSQERDDVCHGTTDCCKRCWAPCVSRITKLLDVKPAKKPADHDARRWHKKAKCSRLSLVAPLFAIVMYFVDVAMDIMVAYYHHKAGDYVWFALTIVIIIASSVLVQAWSVLRLRDDGRNNKVGWLDYLDITTDWTTYLLPGPVVRSWRIFKTVRKVRSLDEDGETENNKTQIQRLLIDQQGDVGLLGVLVAFTEDAPQLLLQLYVIVLEKRWAMMSISNAFAAINVLKSLVLFAGKVGNYAQYTHKKEEDKMSLSCFAQVGQYVWNFFCLVSRVLALVLFASVFKAWVMLVFGIHFAVSFVLLYLQECEYFKNSKSKTILFKLALAYVHEFCFFPLAESKTRTYAWPYYWFTFIENTLLIVLWCLWTDYSTRFVVIAVVVEGVSFLVGILGMVSYYRLPCCHPERPGASSVVDAKSFSFPEPLGHAEVGGSGSRQTGCPRIWEHIFIVSRGNHC